MKSGFKISAEQRQRLLAKDYRPLVFDIKPTGCEPGAIYVLARARDWGVEDGRLRHLPPAPVWFITVTSRKRRRQGGWIAWFNVTDLRDPDVFLRPGGGDLHGSDPLGAGRKPDPEWVRVRARTVGEFWHAERLKRHAEEQRLWGRERSKARRKRAA